jgi:hypothetical protein
MFKILSTYICQKKYIKCSGTPVLYIGRRVLKDKFKLVAYLKDTTKVQSSSVNFVEYYDRVTVHTFQMSEILIFC